MKNYKIIIQYEGTRFQGWQRQASTENTIQGKIEAILTVMCGQPVEINGAGRTDSGVHAKAQVANFRIDTDKNPDEIMDYLNRYLPEDIAVVAIEEAEERFHARLRAKGKHYRYRIRTTPVPDVFSRKYVYVLPGNFDIAQMQRACEMLSGEHDFRSFTSNHRIKKSTVRNINIMLTQTDEEIILDYTGDGFLYHMVRILTGTLIEIGRKERNPEDLEAVFRAGDRSKAGYLVPAQGLTLMEVYY